jgi:site-specific recombinase XerD
MSFREQIRQKQEMHLTTIVTGTPLDLAIAAWLDAKHHASKSSKTVKAYSDTIQSFRASLQHVGLDLDSDKKHVSLVAQKFASFSVRGTEVTSSTFNQRLSILSSFYEYAIKQEMLDHNPVKRIERAKIQQYANAQPIEETDVASALASIDRSTLAGARDYAILALLLQTGRRLSEVAHLTWQDVKIRAGKATVTFAAKGGKTMIDQLPKDCTTILLKWLHAFYGLGSLAHDTPLFVSLAKGGRGGRSYGLQLSTQAIADICEKHLGTSKVHATRHTWAHTMENAGASVSEIQARLGHASLATTGRYLASLKQAENKHGETISALLGIKA